MFVGWGIVLKNREQESLIKSFFLFYLSMQLLVAVILYLYYHSELSNTKQKLFLQMQNYSLTLKGKAFDVDIQTKTEAIENFVLYEDDALYAYFPISGVEDTVLKISLSSTKYQTLVKTLKDQVWIMVLVSTLILMILAFIFSLYSLKPLRQSIMFLEEFLKDIIHDLNTPVTAILLNAKLLQKKFKPERLERIELSAKTIGTLHKNLESFLDQLPETKNDVDVESLLQERTAYFQSIYHDLEFKLQTQKLILHTNEDALRRIIDNLLSNACKYNQSNGWIAVVLNEKEMVIEDSGIGIKNPSKVFDRFYKEGERGLGIGLNIVQKLCDTLGLSIELVSSSEGTHFTIRWR
jgi:two-component system OmpR family sensor kinase